MKFRKKEIKNLDEAMQQEEFKSEAERAFEEAAAEGAGGNNSGVPEPEKRRGKSIKEIRLELEEQDKKMREEKAAEESGENEKPLISDEYLKKSRSRRTKLAVAAFVLLLGIGIMGNWYYENSDFAGTVKPLITGSETKTLGEAEYVDATTVPQIKTENEYFSSARLDRETARDEALEKLQAVVDSPDESAEAKQTATEAITRMSNYISIENKIETLVSAKGVNNCLAVVSSDGMKVDVIVDTEDLSDELVLQIKEIAIQQLGCAFDAVSIIQST